MGRLVRTAACLLALPVLTYGEKATGFGRHSPWQSEDDDEDYESRKFNKGGGGKGKSSGGFDSSGLEEGLKGGGAAGLIEALKAMQMMKQQSAGSSDSAMHIRKDENGQLMYDFRAPSTTTPPAPPPTHPPPRIVKPPTVDPVTASLASKVASLKVKGAQQLQAPGLPPVAALPQPGAALPGASPPAAFAGGAGAPAAGGFQLQALAAGLAAVKERVDVLVEDAQLAMGGRAIPPAAMSMVQPPAQAGSPAVSAELQSSVKDLLPRVAALEEQSKSMQQEVKSVKLRKSADNATKKAASPAKEDPATGALQQQNQQMKMQLKKQAEDIKAVEDAEKSEKDRLGKVEAENDELQKEVKALLALEKKRITIQKKQRAKKLQHRR